jgi:hypothetical protein
MLSAIIGQLSGISRIPCPQSPEFRTFTFRRRDALLLFVGINAVSVVEARLRFVDRLMNNVMPNSLLARCMRSMRPLINVGLMPAVARRAATHWVRSSMPVQAPGASAAQTTGCPLKKE